MYTYIHTYIHMHIHMYLYIHIYASLSMYSYIHVCIYIYIYMCYILLLLLLLLLSSLCEWFVVMFLWSVVVMSCLWVIVFSREVSDLLRGGLRVGAARLRVGLAVIVCYTMNYCVIRYYNILL